LTDVERPTFLVILLSTAGCLSTNTYATPDVVPVGRWETSLDVDAARLAQSASTPHFARKTDTVTEASLVPNVMTRFGVSDRVDVGLGGPIAPRIDVKVQLAKGPLAAALDPRVQLVAFNGLGWIVDVPAILGAKVGSSVTLLAVPGMAVARPDPSYGDAAGVGAWARLGLGVRFSSRKVYAQPEITGMKRLGDAKDTWLSGGIALGWRSGEDEP
jgi:hypothetical protein